MLLGQDGWADGRYGDYAKSGVSLNDSRLIAYLLQEKLVSRNALLQKMQQLADADASALSDELNAVIEQHDPKKIIVLTHVPPFPETCLYQNKISGSDFLPFFGSKSTGDVLLKVANANPKIDFLVLCGHTHHRALHQRLDNLTIKVGHADYGTPQIEEIIEL